MIADDVGHFLLVLIEIWTPEGQRLQQVRRNLAHMQVNADSKHHRIIAKLDPNTQVKCVMK